MDTQSIIKSVLRNLGILIFAIALAYFLARPLWEFYNSFFHEPSSWLDLGGTIGLIFGYVFFVPVLLGLFGTRGWSYWIGLFWTPVALFEIYLGLHQMVFSLSLVLGSLGLGIGLYFLKQKFWDPKTP